MIKLLYILLWVLVSAILGILIWLLHIGGTTVVLSIIIGLQLLVCIYYKGQYGASVQTEKRLSDLLSEAREMIGHLAKTLEIVTKEELDKK